MEDKNTLLILNILQENFEKIFARFDIFWKKKVFIFERENLETLYFKFSLGKF